MYPGLKRKPRGFSKTAAETSRTKMAFYCIGGENIGLYTTYNHLNLKPQVLRKQPITSEATESKSQLSGDTV